MNNRFRASAFTLITMGALTSCAQNYSVSTNLDKENFADYFSPSEVIIYQDKTDFQGRYKSLGLVEGESCQLQAHHAAPNEIDARTLARKKAYQKQANAIIFSGCADIESQNCDKQIVCYGHIYQIEAAQRDAQGKD